MVAAHIPVLLDPLLRAVAPVSGVWVDGTFGAGGYARALLDAGADQVIGIDRDPSVFPMAEEWADAYGDRLHLVEGEFSDLDQIAHRVAGGPVQGVVLDLGVSSMQLDQAGRGFSFLRDGPLDMRMGGAGPDAATLLDQVDERDLADILFHYGEERASRRIARAIIAARPITRTGELAEIIAGCLPRPKPGQSHPATRSFQAIRIWVNDEFGQLIQGLEAAERALAPDGKLAVVSFHSLEDRVVKRFLQARAGGSQGSRHAPEIQTAPPSFTQPSRRAISADEAELAANPRARSARLRWAIRTDAPPMESSRQGLGLPRLVEGTKGGGA